MALCADGRTKSAEIYNCKTINRAAELAVSVQVINEVCANLIKKAAFNETDVQKTVASFYLDCDVVGFDETLFMKASDLWLRYQFSYWDGLIVAAALFASADTLYSEDMHNGLTVENKLKIVNPF